MYLAPTNFIPSVDQFNIGKFLIRKITKDEQKAIFGISEITYENDLMKSIQFNSPKKGNNLFTINFSSFEIIRIMGLQYVVVCDNAAYIKSNLPKLILTLNLLSTELAYSPFILGQNEILINYPQFTDNNSVSYQQVDSDQIISLFNKIVTLQDSAFEIAVKRFENAITSHVDKKMRLIEMVSMIEGLILSKDSELSFRFSTYLSMLSSHYNFDNKLKYIEAKEIYKLRSKIVHGDAYPQNINDAYTKLLSVTINILRIYIEHNLTAEKIEQLFRNKINI